MGLAVISFTLNGIELSRRIARVWDGEELTLFTKCSNGQKDDGAEERSAEERVETGTQPAEENAGAGVRFVEESVTDWAGEQMRKKSSLLFIGACGIAVRAVAPWLTDKLHDSPVLVMDERGRYVIPVLSGHVGGANELALQLAEKTGAVPVITTATDINRRFAVDLFAKRNDLHIVNKGGIAGVSAKVLAGEDITLSVATGHFRERGGLPAGIRRVSYPPDQPVDILVTGEEKDFEAVIWLRPKEYAVGMGCKRGKEGEKIEAFIRRSLEEMGISETRLFALASIDRKKDEEGLLSWSRARGIPFYTYTAEELQKVEGDFHGSDFVRKNVGVDNVCERAALKACGSGGSLVYEKHGADGMTIAAAKREWSVGFDEE